MRPSGVGKRYARDGPWILRQLELAVGPGELVRIDGVNGSGKSTLLKLVAGIEQPSNGSAGCRVGQRTLAAGVSGSPGNTAVGCTRGPRGEPGHRELHRLTFQAW